MTYKGQTPQQRGLSSNCSGTYGRPETLSQWLKYSTNIDICLIHTEEDYKTALCEVSAFFDNEPTSGTADGNRFKILLALLEAYESKYYAIGFPEPVKTNEMLTTTPFELNQSKHVD